MEFKLLNKKEKLNNKLQKPQEIALIPVQNQNQLKSYAEALQSNIQKKMDKKVNKKLNKNKNRLKNTRKKDLLYKPHQKKLLN